MTILEEFREEYDKQKQSQKIPGDTCPLIDKAIQQIDLARSHTAGFARGWKRKTPETFEDALLWLEAADDALDGMDSLMEMIRGDNEKLRDLGMAWYEISKGALEALELEDAYK